MEIRCPRYLNKPIQVLWWEADEFVVFMIFFTLALVYGYLMWRMMFAVPVGYAKLKSKFPRGVISHLVWTAGFLEIKGYPIYHERRFYE